MPEALRRYEMALLFIGPETLKLASLMISEESARWQGTKKDRIYPGIGLRDGSLRPAPSGEDVDP